MDQIEQRNPCIMNVTLGVREVCMFTAYGERRDDRNN